MAMSKKDYVAIAREVKLSVNCAGSGASGIVVRVSLKVLAEGLADMFAADTPRFNRDVFLAACGVA